MIKLTIEEALVLFYEVIPRDYTKVVERNNCSCRLGGWLIKDTNNKMIGFVTHAGSAQYHDYRDSIIGEDVSLLNRKPFIL
jgi:hypothetical protein